MIYTLTLNPSVDYVVELDDVMLGELNRSKNESKFPGGKGINVSQVLSRLNINNCALGFIGGFTGDFIEGYLQQQNIATDLIRIQGDSRINVKLRSSSETEINSTGPNIPIESLEELKKKIVKMTDEDLLILAGSIPSTLPSTTYQEIVEICRKNNSKFIVDAEGELLKKVIPQEPFLIKPNHHELGDLFQTSITTIEDAIHYGKKLITNGAQNVIVSLADKGAVLITKNEAFISSVPKGELKSSVGAGDSMVAGFVATYHKTQNVEEAFRFSVASGSATAFSIGLCTLEKIEELLPQVKIERRHF